MSHSIQRMGIWGMGLTNSSEKTKGPSSPQRKGAGKKEVITKSQGIDQKRIVIFENARKQHKRKHPLTEFSRPPVEVEIRNWKSSNMVRKTQAKRTSTMGSLNQGSANQASKLRRGGKGEKIESKSCKRVKAKKKEKDIVGAVDVARK